MNKSKIKSIKKIKTSGKVYDLSLDSDHLFYARSPKDIDFDFLKNVDSGSKKAILVHNSPPDLDIDFLKGTDHLTDNFLYQKYGRSRVMSVSTFSTFNEKGCLKDVARCILGPSATETGSVVYRATDEMPTFSKKLRLEDWFRDWPNDPNCSESVREFLTNPDNKKVLDYTLKLQGQIRGIGQHAAGVVITPSDSWEYIPTNVIPQKDGPPSLVTAFQESDGSGKDLSALGILKLDRLKLETINLVEDCVALIKDTKGEDIRNTLYNLDLTDKNLYDEVRLGLNHGVFQFESAGMGNLIKSMNVETFDELVACNALYRPGPMGIGAHEEFVRNKFNPSGIQYIHPSLKPILSQTNGVLVFQEQLMFIAHEIGGLTLGEGDLLRRYMGNSGDLIQKELDGIPLTKDEDENKNFNNFRKYWGMFLEGAKKNGYSDHEVEALKGYLLKYLGYSFNKSHSLCYSYVACQTLYLKHYYPTEYYTCLLNHVKSSGKPEEVSEWISSAISSAISKGIEIKHPTRSSGWNWTMTGDNEISMGFSAIKGFGDIAFNELKENIGKKGYTFKDVTKFSFFDTSYTAFNKTAFTALLDAGVFDDWSDSREELLDLYLKSTKAKKKRKVNPNQVSLFGNDFQQELKPTRHYDPTSDMAKRVAFNEVCNCDLEYIKSSSMVRHKVAEAMGQDIPSVIDYEKAGIHYFILLKKEYKMSKKGNQYLMLTVSNGITNMRVSVFGEGNTVKVDSSLEIGGVYISKFKKNNGFMNFDRVIPKSERGKVRPKGNLFFKEISRLEVL